ncbi:MAG: hypothetical protein ABI977_13535 [Acidobacteriota bacterium]
MFKRAVSILVVFLLATLAACQRVNNPAASIESDQAINKTAEQPQPAKQNSGKLIHAVVALCDNQFQGIVPVPAKIGNGDDPANNLYWGAAFGVKTFFKRGGEWKLLADIQNPSGEILERLVFKHATNNVFFVADAYRGREIKRAVMDFFEFSAGRKTTTIKIKPDTREIELHLGGSADLIAYIGHDGLMDFSLDSFPQKADDRRRDAVMLACISKRYFAEPLRATGANPLLWTTGLMAPESYVLKAVIDGWLLGEGGEQVRKRAAAAYNQYQRCGTNAALRLFASGW